MPAASREPSLSEKVLLIEASLQSARIPHAFGGAIALAYYATPRATIDIDVNVFVGSERAEEVLRALARLGAQPPSESESVRLRRDGQARIRWGATPVDLFFSYDAFHDACMERRRVFPFGEGEAIHVLAAEDLVVFKAIFDREKDWRDIAELVFAVGDELDAGWIESWLERIVGREDERHRRCMETLSATS
ncbi:MAG: nucleotidyl transferase AbiEii/AbiGii toxin family protein [bacterium]